MGRSQLTEHQLELLSVLWEQGPVSVQQVHQTLAKGRDVAAATVATMLNRMCKDGTVERIRVGRHFEYRALVGREQLQQSMLSRLLDKVFQGDTGALLSHLVREKRISSKDLDTARALLGTTKSRGEE